MRSWCKDLLEVGVVLNTINSIKSRIYNKLQPFNFQKLLDFGVIL